MRRNWTWGVIVLTLACAMTANDALAKRRGPGGDGGGRGDGVKERPGGQRPGEAAPAEIAKRCVDRANKMAEQCAKRNAGAAERCAAEIGELVAAGQVDEAENVAAHCARRINRGSDGCIRMISTGCDRCVRVLTHLEATDLIDGVKGACRAAAKLVDDSREEALAAIDGAFPAG